MDKEAIARTLRELATGDAERSKTARLRDVIEDVEMALAAGVSRNAVLRVLAQQGLEMSLPSFDTALKRIRQQRRRVAGDTTAGPKAAARVSAPGAPEDPRPLPGSHDPAALDEIISSKPDLSALAKLAKRKTR